MGWQVQPSPNNNVLFLVYLGLKACRSLALQALVPRHRGTRAWPPQKINHRLISQMCSNVLCDWGKQSHALHTLCFGSNQQMEPLSQWLSDLRCEHSAWQKKFLRSVFLDYKQDDLIAKRYLLTHEVHLTLHEDCIMLYNVSCAELS